MIVAIKIEDLLNNPNPKDDNEIDKLAYPKPSWQNESLIEIYPKIIKEFYQAHISILL